MRRKVTKSVAVVLAAALALAGCSGNSKPASSSTTAAQNDAAETTASAETTEATTEAAPVVQKADPIKDWVVSISPSAEIQTFFIQASESAGTHQQIGNLYEGFLETDEFGRVKGALAKEWGSDDGGKTWTFKIREGVQWVDYQGNPKGEVTSDDWITSLEWVLNFHKNNAVNSSMPVDLIEGAEEYYNYTKNLDAAEALALDRSKFLEMVKIETPDDYTVTYTCTRNAPYFDTVALCACLYPVAQGYIDEVGIENAIASDNTKIWYNGCYTCTDYIQNNEKILTKNPYYWDQDADLFDTVTIKVVESNSYQLYQAGEIDSVTVGESTLKMITESGGEYAEQLVEGRPNFAVYNYVFNFNKHLEDGSLDTNWNTAIANENFRQAMYYGINWKPFLSRTNSVNPLSQESETVTGVGVIVLDDGTDYTDIVRDKLGFEPVNYETPVRYQPEKAAEYKAKAIEELTAKGVTFPVKMAYYISASSQSALDSANTLKQMFSNDLGDDFIEIEIKTYVSSASNEVYKPKLHSFSNSGWSADYGDPLNYLGQYTYGDDAAYYSINNMNINDPEVTDEALIETFKTFTQMVEEADLITDDTRARYDAFADAEVYWLQHALTIPTYRTVSWELTHVNDYSKPRAAMGCQKVKYKNWETSKEAYTTEEYELLKADYNAKLEAIKSGN